MFFEYQKAYDGPAVIVAPVNKLIYLRAGQAGILREFTVFLGGSLTGSVNKAIFNLRKNGVSLFSGSGRLIVQDSHTATLSGLNISLAKGDELQLDIEQTPNASRILNPVTLVLAVENDFPAWTAEQIQDLVAAMFVTGTRTSWIYDDTAGTLRVDATTLTDEEVQDKVAAFLLNGTNVTINYNDGANTLTISSTDTSRTDEEIQDVVAALLQQGSNVTLVYNDAGNTLTVSATATGGNTVTYGTAAPSGGNNGDVYFQTTSGNVTSVYQKVSGTWTKIGDFGTSSGSGGAAITYGTGNPSGGSSGDVYFKTAGSVVAEFWKNLSGTWTQISQFANSLSVAAPIICQLTTSANVALTNGAWTLIPFDTEISDTANLHSTASNTSRITIASAGWYQVVGQVYFGSNSGGMRAVNLYVNGSLYNNVGQASVPNGSFQHRLQFTGIIFLNAGDYVELGAFQNAGTLNAEAGGATNFSVMRVADVVGSPVNRKSKTVDDTRTNTTTLTADSELQFSVLNGKKYCVRGILNTYAISGATKFDFNSSGTVSGVLAKITTNTTSGSSTAVNNNLTSSYTVAGGLAAIIEFTIMFNATANGTFSVRFAQNSATSGDTTYLFKESYVEWNA